jgi:outer membrane protein OmpA-like peptidoglycan-associated protein
MRKLAILILTLCLGAGSFAQDSKKHVKPATLVVQFGMFDFATADAMRKSSIGSVIANEQWTKLKDMNAGLGFSFIKGLNNHIDYSVNGFFSSLSYPYRDNTPPSKSNYLLTEIDASGHLKLLTDNYIVVPYLSAGIGGSIYEEGKIDAFMPLGAGLQFRLGPGTFAFSNFQYRVPVTARANYHFLYTLGVGTSIGKKKEPEVKQVPPPPPPPPPPADTDGDGIVDTNDKCPSVKGVAKYQGCPVPDGDGDGINDEEDKCPTVAGIARYQGCPVPDTDGDGINDDNDKCPTVAGFARLEGCPIPDRDGDGVNDEEDRCPDAPGTAERFGCPEIRFRPDDVHFATGSAVLTARGKQELEIVREFCEQNPDLKFIIEGHTDNTGSAKINKPLSLRRANAAKAYLVSKGLAADRFKTAGFGSEVPVADNKTTEGRKKNRRVDVKLDRGE